MDVQPWMKRYIRAKSYATGQSSQRQRALLQKMAVVETGQIQSMTLSRKHGKTSVSDLSLNI